jgi:hypothetical protein
MKKVESEFRRRDWIQKCGHQQKGGELPENRIHLLENLYFFNWRRKCKAVRSIVFDLIEKTIKRAD